MPKWKDMLVRIEKMERKYGSSLRNSTSDTEINKLNEFIQQKLGEFLLPNAYIEFLKNVNGLDFNGLVIYGVDEVWLDREADEDVQGFIETNELWYEIDWHKQYVFLGDSDTALYCFDLKEHVFVELDKPSGTIIQSFESFDFMINAAMETVL